VFLGLPSLSKAEKHRKSAQQFSKKIFGEKPVFFSGLYACKNKRDY